MENNMKAIKQKVIFEVIVGNIGNVYTGSFRGDAYNRFNTYIQQSKDNYGRAAGENVTMFRNNEIVKEFIGAIDQKLIDNEKLSLNE